MSNNPPDPWKGDGSWLPEYMRALDAWYAARIKIERDHQAEMRELESKFHRRARVVACSAVGWVCIGIGANLGREQYREAAIYAVCSMAGVPSGALIWWAMRTVAERHRAWRSRLTGLLWRVRKAKT